MGGGGLFRTRRRRQATRLPRLATQVSSHPNLFVTRTFSKTWGLPSLRIGYLISHPDNIKALCSVLLAPRTPPPSPSASTPLLARPLPFSLFKNHLTGAVKAPPSPSLLGTSQNAPMCRRRVGSSCLL